MLKVHNEQCNGKSMYYRKDGVKNYCRQTKTGREKERIHNKGKLYVLAQIVRKLDQYLIGSWGRTRSNSVRIFKLKLRLSMDSKI